MAYWGRNSGDFPPGVINVRLLGAWFAVVCALTTSAWAQSTGRLSGLVEDPSGAPVKGASIRVYVAGGTTPVLKATSNDEGRFFFGGVQPVTYDLRVDAAGFHSQVWKAVKVDPGVELSLSALRLQVAAQTEVIEVTADSASVQTSNAEVAATASVEQVRRLPALDRNPLALVTTQAGVSANQLRPATINGLRPSFTNMTLDGVNIQDNYIRTSSVTFTPNALFLDQVSEFTVATSNANPADGNGVAQLKFITPSGGNQFHGALYWFNRNNKLSANDWFNNKNGIDRPFLNQNQGGGSLGGPTVKDKLFFYSNYEIYRRRQQLPQVRSILTSSARNGIFSYRDDAGTLRQVNLFTVSGLSANPAMGQYLAAMPVGSAINSSQAGDGLNTGGYAFNAAMNNDRDNVTGKLDYIPSVKHVLSATYKWNRSLEDRPDLLPEGYTVTPAIRNDDAVNFFSGTWRWSPAANFTSELRGGFNLAPGTFSSTQNYGASLLTMPSANGSPLISNPVNTFLPQGRKSNVYSLAENASWFKGKHTLQFGAQYQRLRVDSYFYDGTVPTYSLGFGPSNGLALTGDQLPGISAQDLDTANALLALQTGTVSSASQTFNVAGVNTGYVAGAPNSVKFRQDDYSLYFNDVWRVSRKLTVTLGARWEYYTPVNEVQNLALLPVLQNNNAIQTLLSPDTMLDFAGTYVKRPFYGRDFNNLGPNVGLAWQPFGDGKTVFRAGYSVNFPNDEFIRAIQNSLITNTGLTSSVYLSDLNARVGSGLPAMAAPAFQVPRSLQENYSLDTTNAVGMPDPNLRTPYVQQWNAGIQREIGKGILEVRYAGNHATKQFRAIDYNQVQVRNTPYFTDFQKAQSNGNLALKATGSFDPSYNPAIAGSQALPFFDALPYGGFLFNGYISGLIQRGEAGELGATYQSALLNGDYNFFQNSYVLGANMLTNYSNSTYHAMQVDYRRSYSNGFQFQVNYALSKVLSDAAGDGQDRFEPFMDINNAAIERSRTPFDLRHALKMNGVWDLPVGKGRALDFHQGLLNQVIGGWAVSGFMTWQSGAPFSILSQRGTLNREGSRSSYNTVDSTLSGSALTDALGFRMTGDGPYFIVPSAIDPNTGRGVAGDGASPFSGQIFTNPAAGSLGSLQRRMFTGPSFWNLDFAALKRFALTDRQSLEFRSEFFNLTNHPNFVIDDASASANTNVNSSTFGRVVQTAGQRRIVQFSLFYQF